MGYKILVINPGSTSTKIAVYDDETPVFTETLGHHTEELKEYPAVFDQLEFRKNCVLKTLKKNNIALHDLSAVVGRGGLLKPIAGGTYAINDAMLEHLKVGYQGEHASNLGGILAETLASRACLPSYIVDPVVVDERQEIAKLSGLPGMERTSIFHALNHKAVAKRYAKESGRKYEELHLIVAHLGGGVTVGAHYKGKVIDNNNGLDGDGPFSPERAGFLPTGKLVDLCFSGKYTKAEVKKLLAGKGGFVAHLGTNDMRVVEKLVEEGNPKAELLFHAFCYQVSKSIGECASVLKGKTEAIILTGGIAYSKLVTEDIKEYTQWIAPVIVYPGEDEMLALAQGALRVLKKEETPMTYR